ncbi:C40 family peptidase [Alkalibacillus flavidus]
MAIMIIPFNSIQADEQELIRTAKQYIGTPYSLGAMNPSVAFDCSGYIKYVFQQFDEDLPRTTDGMYSVGESVSKGDLKVGDIVFFNTSGSGVSHAGIYIGDNQFIHASSSNGVTIDNINGKYYWGPKYIGAKRVADFDDEQQEVVQASMESAGIFDDLSEDHWAYDAAETLYDQGILEGVGNNKFAPKQNVTRQQVIKLLMSSEGFDASATAEDVGINGQLASWAEAEVASAKTLGHLDYLDGAFNGEESIDRTEVAILMSNVFDYNYSGSSEAFPDVSESHDAYESIMAMKENGITEGNDAGEYQPDKTLSRAEFAVLLNRAISK